MLNFVQMTKKCLDWATIYYKLYGFVVQKITKTRHSNNGNLVARFWSYVMSQGWDFDRSKWLRFEGHFSIFTCPLGGILTNYFVTGVGNLNFLKVNLGLNNDRCISMISKTIAKAKAYLSKSKVVPCATFEEFVGKHRWFHYCPALKQINTLKCFSLCNSLTIPHTCIGL